MLYIYNNLKNLPLQGFVPTRILPFSGISTVILNIKILIKNLIKAQTN